VGGPNSFTQPFLIKQSWCSMEKYKDFLPFYEQHKDEVASIAFVIPDDKLVFSQNHACHAGLNCSRSVLTKDMKMVISGFQKCAATEKEKRIFIDYMLNKSPWKEVFLNPDVDHVLTNHWWADANAPSNFLANALVATRLPTEFPSCFKVFLSLLKEGLSGDEAYLMSLLLSESGDTFSWSPKSGHICFNFRGFNSVYKRFIDHNPKDVGPPFKEKRGYTSNNGVWSLDDYGYGSAQQDNLFRIVPASKMVTKSLNIFYKPKTGQYQHAFKRSDLLPLAKQIKEIVYG